MGVIRNTTNFPETGSEFHVRNDEMYPDITRTTRMMESQVHTLISVTDIFHNLFRRFPEKGNSLETTKCSKVYVCEKCSHMDLPHFSYT